MRVLKTALGKVLDVAFSPDSRAVAAIVEEENALLWNLDSPNIAPVRLEIGGKYRAGGLNFSADGRQLSWQLFDGRRTYDRDTRDATSEYPALLATATVSFAVAFAGAAPAAYGGSCGDLMILLDRSDSMEKVIKGSTSS